MKTHVTKARGRISHESRQSRLRHCTHFLALNPWSRFQRSRKIEKGNVVIEEDELGIRRPYDSSLFWALIQTIWRRLLSALFFEASSSVLFTTSSLVTKRLIAYIATSHAWSKASELDRAELTRPKSVGTGIALAIGLALMQEAGSVLHSHYQGTAYTCGQCYWDLSSSLRAMYLIRYFSGIIMKSAVTDQIARKSFRLSPRSQVESTHGQQTSAIGADCGYIDQCFPYLVQIIVKPFTIVVGFVLLLLNLGPSALVVRRFLHRKCISSLVTYARAFYALLRGLALWRWPHP